MSDAAEPSRPAEGDARTQTDAPCPICAEPVRLSADTFPFCSQRCRLVDLGRWLDGKYRISRPSRDDAAES